MFCENCRVEIPPAWVTVIAKNECPACGGEIMSESTKELLEELSSAMERMPNDPEGLAGWLLSNYSLKKIGSAEPTLFYRKESLVKGSELKVADNPVQKFLKRTNAPHAMDNHNKLKAMLSKLSDQDSSLYGGEGSDVELDDLNEIQLNAEPKDIVLAKKLLANNSLVSHDKELEPLSSNEVKAMVESVSGLSGGDASASEALRRSRIDRLKKQDAIASGGTADFGSGKGTFRRGS
jgi:hypothetical protein